MQPPSPLIVEIVGISGAGKSTLADALVQSLSDQGIPSIATRRSWGTALGFREGIAGVRHGLVESLRLATCFAPRGRMTGRSIGRFRRGARGAIWQGMALASERYAVLVTEPGWTMQFVGLCMQLRAKADLRTCNRLMARMFRPDLLVVLENSVDSSLDRMALRQKGVPRSMKRLETSKLRESLECGRSACESLTRAAEQSGVTTLVLSASERSADEILTSMIRVLLPLAKERKRQIAGGRQA